MPPFCRNTPGEFSDSSLTNFKSSAVPTTTRSWYGTFCRRSHLTISTNVLTLRAMQTIPTTQATTLPTAVLTHTFLNSPVIDWMNWANEWLSGTWKDPQGKEKETRQWSAFFLKCRLADSSGGKFVLKSLQLESWHAFWWHPCLDLLETWNPYKSCAFENCVVF